MNFLLILKLICWILVFI